MMLVSDSVAQTAFITPDDGARALDDAQDCIAAFMASGLRASLCEMIGTGSPTAAFAVCLGRIAGARPASARALPRAALLLVACIHSQRHFRPCKRPPFSDSRDDTLRPVDWLLLAGSAASVDVEVDAPTRLALAQLAAMLHPRAACPPPFLLSENAPFLSYAAAELLALACATNDVRAAGNALGRLVRLTEELAALHCDDAAGLGKAEPHWLSHIALSAGVPEAAVRVGWARAAAPIPERAPLRSLLAQRPVLDAVSARVEACIQEASAGLPDEHARACIAELVLTCRRILRRALAAARLAAVLPLPVPEGELVEPARTIRMARAALASDPGYHEAIEVQRWGCWASEPRFGRLFPIGLCLLARAAVGDDVAGEIDDLLARRRADGYRYYEDWCGGLPGVDDLGLVLQLFPHSTDWQTLRRALAWPMEQLLRHTSPEGSIPTWFEYDLIEPPPASAPEWCRSRCMGVALNVLSGLLQARWPLPDGYFDRLLAYTLAWYEREGDASIAFYPASYIRFQLARLFRDMDEVSVDPLHCAQLRAILDRLGREVCASQRADGSWGSPMTTAFHLAMLELAGVESFAREAALTYLQTQQEPDGLWPREPLFGTIGKDSAPYNYGSRSVTTAFCLYAVALAGGALPGR